MDFDFVLIAALLFILQHSDIKDDFLDFLIDFFKEDF